MNNSILKARSAKANAIAYMVRDWVEAAFDEIITGKKFENEILRILNDDDVKWMPPSENKVKKITNVKKVVDKSKK